MSKKIARDLNSVNMEERIYQVENETEVIKDDITEITEKLPVANPETEATETLEKITIDGDTYEIGGGGLYDEALTTLYPEYDKTVGVTDVPSKVIYNNKIYLVKRKISANTDFPESNTNLVQQITDEAKISISDMSLTVGAEYPPTYDFITWNDSTKELTVDLSDYIQGIKNDMKFINAGNYGDVEIKYNKYTDTIIPSTKTSIPKKLITFSLDRNVYFMSGANMANVYLPADFSVKVIYEKTSVTTDSNNTEIENSYAGIHPEFIDIKNPVLEKVYVTGKLIGQSVLVPTIECTDSFTVSTTEDTSETTKSVEQFIKYTFEDIPWQQSLPTYTNDQIKFMLGIDLNSIHFLNNN